jgi:hypothetical protein
LNIQGGQNLNFAIDSRVALSLWSDGLSVSTKGSSKTDTSSNWRSFSHEDWVYDATTIRREGSIVSIWIRSYGSKGFNETLWEFNCREKACRRIKANTYLSGGELYEGNKHLSGEWSKTTPNSVGEQWVQTACGAK